MNLRYRIPPSWRIFFLWAFVFVTGISKGQSTGSVSPAANSVTTPRPFDPGQNTTNPSAFAVQTQNPFLGSVPTGPLVPGVLPISLTDAVNRAMHANLGFVDSEQEHAQSRAARIIALSLLLPQLKAETTAEYRNLVSDTLGVPKLGLPHVISAFNYQSVHAVYQQHIFDMQAVREVKSASREVDASEAQMNDARNVVVLASVSSYLLVAASQTRLDTTKAQLATAMTTDAVVKDRVDRDVSPEIDHIRSRVALRSAELRVKLAATTLAKDKLALTRIIGLPIEQEFSLTDGAVYHGMVIEPLSSLLLVAAERRQDIKAAESRVEAADQAVKAAWSQRIPTLDVNANAGETGIAYGSAYRDYEVEGKISVPIFTGRRIEGEVAFAKAILTQRRAELADVKGRAAYDVRTALLDLDVAETSVQVSLDNQALADEGLRQAQSRYENGVSNSVDLLQAQQAVAEAGDNRIASVYSDQLAKLMLVRAMGTAEQDYTRYIGVR
jgi:outer membrane protein TolC